MLRHSCALAAVAITFLTAQPSAQTGADAALIQKARGIHDRVITLDTHADINPENFTRQKNYTQRLETQVNLPKMVEGGLDTAFFIVYVGQGPLTPEGYDSAYKQAVAKFDAVKHLTSEIAPGQIGLALTAADVPRIAKSGKKVALIGIENAYSLGTDIKRVKEFHDRGGRYMSLAHNGHSQFADSNTGERDGKWLHNGLSDLGKQVIAEMNKWGIMVDLSHPSKAANMQALALSKAPVIASHSAARALADHSRNMDDEQLEALKKNGGVIQTVAFAAYVKIAKPDSPESGGGDRRAAKGVRPSNWCTGCTRCTGCRWGRRPRRPQRVIRRAAREVRCAHGGDRQEDAGRSARDRGRLRQSH